jgi:tetratricopeptide (TPR) repeat protein
MQGIPALSRRFQDRVGSDRPVRIRLAELACALTVSFLALACGSSLDSRLEEVRTLQDAGQFNESVEPLRSILEESPDLAEANHRLGVALVQTGQASLAVWPLEKSAKSPEFAVPSGLLLASAFLSVNAPDDAIRISTRVLETDPGNVAALRMRTHAQLAVGNQEEALAGATRLREMQPDDYQAAVLLGSILADAGRLDDAEKAYQDVKDLGAKSGDPGVAARGCLALANFYDTGRKDAARAEAQYLECLATYSTEPLALQLASQFYDKTSRSEKGTELWRKAVEEAPENLSFRVMLAERVARSGKIDEAQAILVEAAESFATPGAWQVLADFQRRHGRRDEAAASLERAAQLAGGGDDNLRFAQGDLYVDLGRLDQADEVLAAIQEPAYREILRGRILLAKGDAKGALEAFDIGLRRWPNNAPARYMAGAAARDAGDEDRAISEFREAVRTDVSATDAALALAALYLERGENGPAANFAMQHVAQRDPTSLPAFRIAARAATREGEFDAARSTLDNMSEIAGAAAAVAVERAAVERAAKGPAQAVVAIESARLDLSDPANEDALRTLSEDLLALGRGESALGRIDAALAANPDKASLLELRGVVLARLGRKDDARVSFEKAAAADPASPRALIGLASIEVAAGNPQAALEIVERAGALDPKNVDARYLAAQIALGRGDMADAEQRLRAVLGLAPSNAAALNDLAWILASGERELDQALAMAERAAKVDPSADVLDTLGYVRLKRGDAAGAIASFESALRLRPKDPTIRYHLGLALARSGDRDKAMATLREALALGPFPDADAAKQEIARLEQPQG